MKLNKIFMALAAMAVVGCSSDDLNVLAPEQQAAEDSQLIQLDPNFVIAGVGAEDNGTRTHWEWNAGKTALVNKFLPIYTTAPDNTKTLDELVNLEAEAVGLCWLGNGTRGTDVYTNYQFYHFGWLDVDETEAEFDCGVLTNGSLYSDITPQSGAADDEADPENHFSAGAFTGTKVWSDLNYNSGIYKTDNKSIFKGTYIVYYPFNEEFKEAGTIPAKAKPTWDAVPTTLKDPRLGEATFRYSSEVTIEGGAKASDFGLYNLSSLVQLKVYAPEGDAAISNRQVDQIVLYSASEKLLKQANLAADKIVAGQKGAGLYASTEGTKTISAIFDGGDEVVLAKKADAVPGAFITVLPTTVSDLKVLVHSTDLMGDDGKWATLDKANTEFKAGSAKVLDICVANADWKADYIAVDDASLRTALAEARVVAVDADHAATITVIGDITLTAPLDINVANDAFITITGDDIIVPEDVTLTVKTNMVSDVRVLGTSCCTGANGGILDIQGGTINNVTMKETEANIKTAAKNPTVNYTGAATVAAGKTIDAQAGTINVSAAVQHKGAIKIAKVANLNVEAGGDLNFMGSTVDNDGTIEVKKAGKFDMTDSDGNATATDGQRMTNNGTFIHNVDAGVGTAVQKMHQNGEYRCKVDKQIKLDDALLQWTACSVIEMVNTSTLEYDLGKVCQHNGKYIDFEVNATAGTTFSNPTPDNKEINIGKLTVKSPFAIDYTNTVGTTTGKRTLTVNGDMAVTANTSIKDSKKINIKQNLTLTGAFIDFAGGKVNEDGLAVTGDITVSGSDGWFAAGDVDALNITCANFYLKSGAKAEFGNRKDGDTKNLVVSGTISNPEGCKFFIKAANQEPGTVLAWVTCKKLEVGGEFSAARPRVE